MFECFVRSNRLFVCQSLHTLKTTYLYGCWVSFQFCFGVAGTWISVWIFVICYLGVGLLFYNFVLVGGGVGFLWNSFGHKLYLSIFKLSFQFF